MFAEDSTCQKEDCWKHEMRCFTIDSGVSADLVCSSVNTDA